MKTKFCILLTASIRPQNHRQGARSSVADREQDYLEALSFYAALGIPVVFCENSGYHSESIDTFCRSHPNIEYVGFESANSYLGKAHGEKEILDKAHASSVFIAESEYVIKITGRLKVKNITAIMNRLSSRLFVISANIGKNLTWADSRFFIYSREYYGLYLEPSLRRFLDEPKRFYFEHCLARAIHRLLSEAEGFILLPLYPEYSGRNGTTNKKYDQNPLQHLIFQIYYRLKQFVFGKIH